MFFFVSTCEFVTKPIDFNEQLSLMIIIVTNNNNSKLLIKIVKNSKLYNLSMLMKLN